MSVPEASRKPVSHVAPAGKNLDFDAIYAEHFAFVWRCLRSLGVPYAALDDAAQEVFVVVHRQLAGFRGESTLSTWLYGVVRNVAYNQRRTLARRGAADPLDEKLASEGQGPEGDAQAAEAADFVARFIETLDSKKRDVFVLAVLEECSIPEVANALAIPLNTAYTRLRAVRGEFRNALARRGGRS